MLEVKVENCAGIDVGKKVFGGLRFNWAGGSEAGRGGSAVRHKRERAGTITGMANGEEVHGSSHGKHGLLLEAGVQHFRTKLEDHFGQPGTSEGATRQEDRS